MSDADIIRCPECGAALRPGTKTCWLCQSPLGAPPPPPPAAVGRPSADGLSAYAVGLREAFRDGQLVPQEAHDLELVARKYGLADQYTRPLRAQMFAQEVGARLADNVLTNEEMQELKAMLAQLSLSPADVPEAMRAIQHTYQLQQIRNGAIPSLDPATTILRPKPGEVVHAETPASVRTTKMVSDGWVSGSSGFSFRIAKGVRWRVGGTRGHMLKTPKLVTESTGTLCLTNQRIAYLASSKAFSVVWSKVLAVDPYADGLTVHIENRSTAPSVIYEQSQVGEYIAAICACYMA